MISEISPATPTTDFTTINILNVFQTKLTMRIYLVPCTCRDNYCFFVVFLSPSWWMPAEYPKLSNNFLSYLSQPTIQNHAPHIRHMVYICNREWLFDDSDTKWQLPLWSSQQLKRYLWLRWHSSVILCHINKIYQLSLKDFSNSWHEYSISFPLAAGSSSCLTYACCYMCSLELLMTDGKTVRNMHSVLQE
jgi:hypothetical protein